MPDFRWYRDSQQTTKAGRISSSRLGTPENVTLSSHAASVGNADFERNEYAQETGRAAGPCFGR